MHCWKIYGKRSAVFVFKKLPLFLIIWNIILFLMFWHRKDAENDFQPSFLVEELQLSLDQLIGKELIFC